MPTTPLPFNALVLLSRDLEALADRAGAGLLPWMVAPGVRQAHNWSATPFVSRGACPVLLVNDEGLCQSPSVMARGWVLPTQWVPGVADSPRLPPGPAGSAGLADVARAVRQALKAEGWGLRLAEELGDVDLSWFPVSAESTFAALAAALRVAKEGGEPLPHVLATGAQAAGRQAVAHVAGVACKLAAVRDLTLKEPPILFVPAANLDEARDAEGGVEVRAYPVDARDWEAVLRPHLSMLDAPPDSGAELALRAGWANRSWREAGPRRTYYRKHLLADLAASLREKTDPAPVKRLVVNLGFAPELTALVIKTFRPDEVRVLVTPESHRQHWRNLCGLVPKLHDGAITSSELTPENVRDVLEASTAWLAEVEVGGRCVDITGGTSLMSAAAWALGQRSRARINTIQNDYLDGTTIPAYHTERCIPLNW